MAALSLGLTLLLSYLVGAIPFGYLVARGRGVDILKQGSGNIGATNVGRVLGRPFGVLVFLLDFAKGAVPALFARLWASAHPLELPPDSLPVAAAVAAFLGHLFPIYLRFRGGKGVATAAGAVSVLLPGPALAALLAWFVVVVAGRYVSLASLTAAAVLCVVRLVFTPQPWGDAHRVVTLFCLIAAGLIFVRHRANIGRLLRGNENRLKETPAMLHVSKILHVLALGLWFGTVIFFTFVVGLNLFGTLEMVAAEAPADRPLWFPVWDVYDGKSPDPAFPEPLRREQGTQAAGVAIHPLFQWYFAIQAVCALLALATALALRSAGARHVHRIRVGILLAALIMVALGWWLDRVVEELRGPRNVTFKTMVSHFPPRDKDVNAAVAARKTFVQWHLYSLGLNMLTVLLVTAAMAQAAYLPSAFPGAVLSMTAKPYDPTLKALVETEPESWPVLLGQPKAPTEVIDADIATVSGAADKVLHVSAEPPYLLHLEFVSGHDAAALPSTLLVRNSLLGNRHDMRVRSGVVLLRPEADSPQLTGVYERGFPDEEAYLTFRYRVVRVWQLPPRPLLSGGLGLLPLAPISAVTEAELPDIIKQIEQRLSSRRGRKQAPVVWGAAYILLGLRYSPALAAQLFRGVLSMKESSTYQAILEEGRTEGAVAEAKKFLRIYGDVHFGPPDARTTAAIERINDLAQLEDLYRRSQTAKSWQELFGPPVAAPRKGRRRQSP